jgi:hypothetical protein
MSLMGDINGAVESAAKGSEGGPTAGTPAAGAETKPSAGGSPSSASAAPSGSEGAPATPVVKESSTTRTDDGSGDASVTTESSGEPPRERWDTILGNARTKARADVLAELGIDGEMQAPEVRAHISALRTDPLAYMYALANSLVRSGHLKLDDPAPGPAVQQPKLPDPDFQTPDGARLYGADAIMEILRQRDEAWRGELQSALAPFRQTQETIEQQQNQATAWGLAEADLKVASTWDGFNDLRKDVAALMRSDPRHTLQSAYITVHQKALQTRDQALRDKVRRETLDELKKSPPATGEIKPGDGAPRDARRRGRSLDSDIESAVRGAFDGAGRT